jgi:hypothetical protein
MSAGGYFIVLFIYQLNVMMPQAKPPNDTQQSHTAINERSGMKKERITLDSIAFPEFQMLNSGKDIDTS